jgi:hypothetical protein
VLVIVEGAREKYQVPNDFAQKAGNREAVELNSRGQRPQYERQRAFRP